MKVRKFVLENVRSFLERQELKVDGDISILVGPNGGGKTNVLDVLSTTIRHHLLVPWTTRERAGRIVSGAIELHRIGSNPASLEKHRDGLARDQLVEIEIEITPSDISNMAEMASFATALGPDAWQRFRNVNWEEIKTLPTHNWQSGTKVNYRVVNHQIAQEDNTAHLFREYLQAFEAVAHVRLLQQRTPLSAPMLTFPAGRARTDIATDVALHSFNEYELRQHIDLAHSKNMGNLWALIVGRLASKYRRLQESDNVGVATAFMDDPKIKALSSALKELGYGWRLETIDFMSNEYAIRLEKNGTSFLLNEASSGERELLLYLFAFHALNIRDAFVLVDEPELHLHPKWQRVLLETLEQLVLQTNSQFLLTTHSPSFISPSSVQYVSRVHVEGHASRIVRLNSASLPEKRHLFSVVNSQSNEKMFFADKVVLVEGISDRNVLEAVMQKLGLLKKSKIIEIIEVHGKGFFPAYTQLLAACSVPHAVVADLDYCQQVGTADIKKLFSVSKRKIVQMLKNAGSQDAAALLGELEKAIASGDTATLKDLWAYIKARQTSLRSSLTLDEQKKLDLFIEKQRDENLFILKKGALEKYLPDGYASKDMDKLIRLVSGDFWSLLPMDARDELKLIAKRLIT